MNIISGIAKGIILNVPKGLAVRPTGARARKSIFDSYGNWENKIVVDLFAGSGALGLEAASRGAANLYSVENSFKHCSIIKTNIEKIKKAGVSTNISLIRNDAARVHKMLPELTGKIDVIFADPPYNDAQSFAKAILNDEPFARWARGALFIFETGGELSRKPEFHDFDLWNIEKSNKLGQSMYFYLRGNI